MTLEEYINQLEQYHSDLESDAEDIENAVSELQEILDGIQGAEGLDNLKDNIESLKDFNFTPDDLIVPDNKALHDNFDPDEWIDNFKNSIQICEKKEESKEVIVEKLEE